MIKVAHYCTDFLPLTCNWIYPQLINTERITSVVMAERRSNAELFQYENMFNINWTREYKFCYPRRFKDVLDRLDRRLFFYPKFEAYIRKNGIDVLHAHFGREGAFIVDMARRLRLPLITSFYGFDLALPKFRYFRKKYKELFAYGSMFLVEGQYSGMQLTKLGCPVKKIQTMHLCFDINKIVFKERRISNDEPFKILISSRFNEKKGIIYGLQAIGELHKRYQNIHVDILGDGPLKRELVNVVRTYGMEDIVKFYGYQHHDFFISKLYDNHVLLSPSVTARDGDNEGGAPVSLIEASASGMPVISSFHCDIPEVVVHNVTGLLAEEKDVATIARHLEDLLRNPHQLLELGRNGRKHAETNYGAKKLKNDLEVLYLTAAAQFRDDLFV